MRIDYSVDYPVQLQASFEVEGFTVLLGQSGEGKTTLLRALAGLLPAQGEPFGGLLPQHRAVGYVPQGYALFPHLCELLKLGFDVAQSTIARYMCRQWRPPSQRWRTFLHNHADGIAAVDLFVLPTIAFQTLYCLVVLRHGRRRWVSFGVTSHPTAEWISRQITEAFPWTMHLNTSSGTGTARMDRCSCGVCALWAFATGQSHPDHPGKMLALRDLLARSEGSASTT